MIYISRFDKYHVFKTLLSNVNFVHICYVSSCVCYMIIILMFQLNKKIQMNGTWVISMM